MQRKSNTQLGRTAKCAGERTPNYEYATSSMWVLVPGSSDVNKTKFLRQDRCLQDQDQDQDQYQNNKTKTKTKTTGSKQKHLTNLTFK